MPTPTPNLWVTEAELTRRDDGNYGTAGAVPKPYDSNTNDRDELFHRLARDRGRFVSLIILERADGPDVQIGWVFESRRPEPPAMIQTWVTLFTRTLIPGSDEAKFRYADTPVWFAR